MIEIKLTPSVIERAKNLYKFGVLKNSITKGKSNVYGAVGEIIMYDYFKNKGLSVNFKSTFDYDLILDGYKVDVKTKKVNTPPKDFYLCGIPACNTRQNTDFYFFAMVFTDLTKGFLLGYKRKEEYFKLADFKKEGSADVNGFKFKSDCYNLKISQLEKFK
jgi:hypothetical protein